MMEMGGSISSLPCVNTNNNEGSQFNKVNAVLDLVDNSDNLTNNSDTVLINDSIHQKLTVVFQKFFRRMEEFMFPKSLLLNYNNNNAYTTTRDTSTSRATSGRMYQTALLRRCQNLQEQHIYIQRLLETCQHLHGMEGLHALGFEYRFLPCDEHKSNHCDIDLSCAVADKVPLNDDACNGDDSGAKVYLSERALRQADEIDIENDDDDERINLAQVGQETLVELFKVKSEKYLSLSNRSDSILSDDGCESLTNGIASHHAEICTTPSLAASLTGVLPPYESNVDDQYGHDPDGIANNIRKTKSTITPNGVRNDTLHEPAVVVYKNPAKKIVHQFCHLCERRLYDIASNTCITDHNRNEYIANGEMYELVSRFVQEYAHDIMIQEGNLIWTNIDDDASTGNNGSTSDLITPPRPNGISESEPIRCLISKDHPCLLNNKGTNSDTKSSGCDKDHRPTLLICTGRGKVRAGIFSRHHLICTSLERSTAIPFIHEAIHRNIHVIIVDPNALGETHGYATFTKSMNFLQPYYDDHGKDDKNETKSHTLNQTASHDESINSNPCCRNMYILSHSASGGHLVRYFLDKCHTQYIRSIRAIAFTDSTHSIQWAKGAQQTYLLELLQSLYCIYFRCSSSTRDTIAGDGDSRWYLHPAGEVVQTDSFWRHRFGNILTVWAGTNEHSQTNWFAHAKIWEHFDQFLFH